MLLTALPWVFGVALLLVGFALELRSVNRPLGVYDEGIILSGARAVAEGDVPYRDFYSNYPPGIFLVVGLILKLGGSLVAYRLFGLLIHLAVAGFAGAISGRILGRPFSAACAGVVLLWLQQIGVPPYAWMLALALTLAGLFFLSMAAERPEAKKRAYAAGALLGALGCVRHDLLVYLTLAFVAASLGWFLLRREWLAPWRTLIKVAIAAAVPLVLCWGWVIAHVGVTRVVEDLFLFQVRYVMPSRVLPMPAFARIDPRLGVPLPIFFVSPFESALFFVLVAPVLGLVAALVSRTSEGKRQATLIAALAVAVIPQASGRTDIEHSIYAVTPALLLLWSLAGTALLSKRVALKPLALPVAAVALLAPAPTVKQLPDWWKAGAPIVAGLAPTPNSQSLRDVLVSVVKQITPPGARIFVGTWNHRRVFINETDLYYATKHLSAVRYQQFDPGLIARPEVQQEMIDSLERYQAPTAVLVASGVPNEPNTSRNEGPALLDQYLGSHYTLAWRNGPYIVLKRK